MNIDISVAIITAVLGLISGAALTYLKYKKELEIEYDKEVRRARETVYLKLWRELDALAKYDLPKPKTNITLGKLSKEMRQWYFDKGGMYLSEESRKPYFALKRAIDVEVNKEPQDIKRDIPGKDWDKFVDIASLLRSSLAKDIGARRKRPVKDS